MAKQSERQLGMFITAGLLLKKQCLALLNPNQEVKFRNNVIHGGYIPTADEATGFGDVVMQLINDSLAELRTLAPEALMATYERLSPAERQERKESPAEIVWNDDEDQTGTVNILTAVDVRHPVKAEDDLRRGGVTDQFKRLLQDREPHRLTMLDEDELRVEMNNRSKGGRA
ncbi:MAG: hypothetical protein L0H94_07830 [Nitrospira sp.]|nr:hypothetical protein [Nitrospira sp.]